MRWIILGIFSVAPLWGCTGIVRSAKNGDVVYARTMEFEAELLSFDLAYVPRKMSYTATTPSGQGSLRWKTRYSHVGFTPFGVPLLADGMNEKGLCCGAFYLPKFAKYQEPSSSGYNISQMDFVSWVLGSFATVAEALDALEDITVVGVEVPQWGFIAPLHFFLTDTSGETVIVEYVNGKKHVYEENLRTVTNSPGYDWHMLNAHNYIGLRALNLPPSYFNHIELLPFGQGSGGVGLPGDFSPPSRFIRALFLNMNTFHGEDGYEEVLYAFKILNQFCIPKGSVQEETKGKAFFSETQWTSAADTKEKLYYFHTVYNRCVSVVDIKKLDPNEKSVKMIKIDAPEYVEDVTGKLKHKKHRFSY